MFIRSARRSLVALALLPVAGAVTLGGLAMTSGQAGAAPKPPGVSRIVPISVPAGTSVPVTIHGNGFDTTVGAVTVSFGGTSAVSVSCKSPSTCVAVTPNLSAGSVSVVVTSNGTALNPETLTVDAYSAPLVRLTPNAKQVAVFIPGGVSDKYPATGAPGFDAVTIENETATSQTISEWLATTEVGTITLDAGDSQTVSLADDNELYVFDTTGGTRTSSLTVKTKAPK